MLKSLWFQVFGFLKSMPIWVWVVTAALAMGGGYITSLRHDLIAEQHRNTRLAYAIDSIQVVNDTLRDLSDSISTALHLTEAERNYFEKRSLQLVLQRDSIDDLLQQESRLRGLLEAQIANLLDTLSAPTEEDGTNRVATFHEYIEPYTVDMHVVLPVPPEIGTAEVSVKLDPFNMGIRVGCANIDPLTGINPASILVDTPSWVTISNLNVSQDREVCNQVEASTSFWKSWKAGAGGVLAIGTIVAVLLGIS